MKKRYYFLITLVGLFVYLLFYPVGINPAEWTPPTPPELTGKYQSNDKLSAITVINKGECNTCEDVAVNSSGFIYGGMADGTINKINLNTGDVKAWANTGGRPFGMHFDRYNNLIVADSEKGVLSVNPQGKITVLTTHAENHKLGFPDDLEIANDGIIYFSDASRTNHHFADDIMEHRPNGSLHSYNPVTKETKTLLNDLYFANGIAVSHDQSFVLVCETGAYRIRRYWLDGPKQGTSDIFIDNLPGFPDGVSQGSDGIFWVGIVSPRNPKLDAMMPSPFKRKIVMRLPEIIKPKPENYGFILGLDNHGDVKYNLQDPNPKFAQITSVQQFGNKLYLGSLKENGIGVYELK